MAEGPPVSAWRRCQSAVGADAHPGLLAGKTLALLGAKSYLLVLI